MFWPESAIFRELIKNKGSYLHHISTSGANHSQLHHKMKSLKSILL